LRERRRGHSGGIGRGGGGWRRGRGPGLVDFLLFLIVVVVVVHGEEGGDALAVGRHTDGGGLEEGPDSGKMRGVAGTARKPAEEFGMEAKYRFL
jgi:hypothetical protein